MTDAWPTPDKATLVAFVELAQLALEYAVDCRATGSCAGPNGTARRGPCRECKNGVLARKALRGLNLIDENDHPVVPPPLDLEGPTPTPEHELHITVQALGIASKHVIALTAQLKELAQRTQGCSDGNCILIPPGKRGGMHTQGGCHCRTDLPEMGAYILRAIKAGEL